MVIGQGEVSEGQQPGEGAGLEQLDGVGGQVELLQAAQPAKLMLTHLTQVTAHSTVNRSVLTIIPLYSEP